MKNMLNNLVNSPLKRFAVVVIILYLVAILAIDVLTDILGV